MTTPTQTGGSDRTLVIDSGVDGRAVGAAGAFPATDPFAHLAIGLACLTLALAVGTTASWALSFRLDGSILLTNYGIVVLGVAVLRFSGRRLRATPAAKPATPSRERGPANDRP